MDFDDAISQRVNPILRIPVKQHIAYIEPGFDPRTLKFTYVFRHLQRAQQEFIPNFFDGDNDFQFLCERNQRRPSLVRGTAANSAIRVGLLGCGGRGTEDASNVVDTGNARVVALADMFEDQLDNARKHFDEMQQGKGYSAIDASQIFVGPKAFQQMAASKEVDAVVIATPPYYHPQHLKAVVAGGVCRAGPDQS